MPRIPASGVQHTLRAGPYEAVIASVGASLRSLQHDGRGLVVSFDVDELRPDYRGATLAPWPNRVVDGRYSFRGQTYELPLTERGRGHALHGLASWLDFHVTGAKPDRVTLTATIEPQAGYPWRVDVETTFSLGPDGLTQSVRGRNRSESPAPWGTAPHPYLSTGASSLDECTLDLPASQVLLVSDDRLIPSALRPVDGEPAGRFDYRAPRPIGRARIDHAYTGLIRSDSGAAEVTLTATDGSGVVMAWDSACPWVQIHTADLPDGPAQAGHRIGLAVEPMTCAPDAYNDANYDFDTALIELAPGETAEASWRIAAV
ncbi:aldose 1-epimerase family protein [Microbacter sp. GSS18]|nr:aldose 1-epimerase family protein [Microbacter sp. GSS18]